MLKVPLVDFEDEAAPADVSSVADVSDTSPTPS